MAHYPTFSSIDQRLLNFAARMRHIPRLPLRCEIYGTVSAVLDERAACRVFAKIAPGASRSALYNREGNPRRSVECAGRHVVKQTIYRTCMCGETAFDLKYQTSTRRFAWACRNCGTLARDRKGQIKQKLGRAPASHDRGVGGDDPQTDKGG